MTKEIEHSHRPQTLVLEVDLRKESHEKIGGSDKRASFVYGKGTGRGFSVENLTLPHNGLYGARKLHEEGVFENWLLAIFEKECADLSVQNAQVYIDKTTGLVTALSVQSNGVTGQIGLSPYSLQREQGAYEMQGVEDLGIAVMLHRQMARYMTQVAQEAGDRREYAYIDGRKGSYGSVGLVVPENLMDENSTVDISGGKERFILNAHNIAGRFGENIKTLMFDERSLLRFVTLEGLGASATQYYRDMHSMSRQNEFMPHNVDSLSQAAALHAITADYLGKISERKNVY